MDPNLVLTISMPPSLMYVTQLHTYLELCQNKTVSLHKNKHTDLYASYHLSYQVLVSVDGNIMIWNMNVRTTYNWIRILCILMT